MRELILAAVLVALSAASPVTAQQTAASSFPTEWQGSKWCPQSDLPPKKIYTRASKCNFLSHINLTADRYERSNMVCRLLSGHEGKHPRGRIYHAVMSCQGEHERWFERADFFTSFPADLLVVQTVSQASKLADLDRR